MLIKCLDDDSSSIRCHSDERAVLSDGAVGCNTEHMRPVAVLIMWGAGPRLIVDRIISLQDDIPTGNVGLGRMVLE